MKAVRLHQAGSGVQVDEVPVPGPTGDEVLIRVEAAGLCGSDAHILNGRTPLPHYPRILGHEVAGTVCELGPGAAGVEIGARVAVNFLITCGQCRYCVSGRTSLCLSREGLGVVRDGGFAEYMAVPARNLIHIPGAVPFRHAALATDAFATSLHAISKRAQVQAGEGCIVVGVGGLGLSAVQLLKIRGAYPIIAVDADAKALELAMSLGATHSIPAGAMEDRNHPAWAVTGGAVHAFDFVGRPETVQAATQAVDRGGRVVVVGHSPHSWNTADGSTMVREEKTVMGSYAFDKNEIEDVLGFMSRGLIDVDTMIGQVIGLDDVDRALATFGAPGRIPGRTIVEPAAGALKAGGLLLAEEPERTMS
jgi:D-arabinose 1-dehydrogenase-like Zn-dependent alcohol dehydrogenase